MPLFWLLALLCGAALTQSLAGSALSVVGGRPDLVLLLVACWSLHRGSQEGSVAGLAGGVLLDLFSAAPFGLHAVIVGLLCQVLGLGEGSPSRGHLLVLVSTAVLATVAFHGASYLALQALGWSLPNALAFARVVVPTAALNALLMPIIYRLLRWLIRTSDWRRLEV